MRKAEVIIIDDEENYRSLVARMIRLEGFTVTEEKGYRKGIQKIENNYYDVVVTDVKMPDGNGLDLLTKVKKIHPETQVIVMTAYGNVKDGVDAMKAGAFDYIVKGDQDEHIHVLVERAVEKSALLRKLKNLEARVEDKYSMDRIIGSSEAIQEAKKMALKVAKSDISVLLQGETGTGKELFAQAIHQASPRKKEHFVAINCSAFPANLLESELFGFKKGAFTGADYDKKGLFEEAHKGTLFLDEIGEMPIELQAKILRVLEEQTFTKLGETTERTVDVRIISATNRDLEKESEDHNFRSDLFYRLAGFKIKTPALSERKEDIIELAEYFNHVFAKKSGQKPLEFSEDFEEALKNHTWKGNIRELKNIIERVSILADSGVATIELLPQEFQFPAKHAQPTSSSSLKEMEKAHIFKVLRTVDGNKTKAAAILEIGSSTLYRKIEEYNLDV
ncbi:sigma-54-dependent transcriptional regulator [Gracilimonas sediminicola]|uniref:sigma-54-dependent transcriptional regulator n=1 Tax=Gracilimonas sediminicola TaxID=2952158 RepID=UPI0038D3788B